MGTLTATYCRATYAVLVAASTVHALLRIMRTSFVSLYALYFSELLQNHMHEANGARAKI